jgi:hypothetical protein
MTLCHAFPVSVLGVMLAFSGLELALVCRDQTRRDDAGVMLATAGVALGLNHVALGLAAGLIAAWGLRLRRRWSGDEQRG